MSISPEWFTAILSNGTEGVLLFVLVALVVALWKGFLRTKFELTAWVERAERAEKQVDTVLPALNRLTDIIQRMRQ